MILLAEGHILYDGPAGRHPVDYFSKINYKCPAFFNPADYFLDITSTDSRSAQAEMKSTARIQFLTKEWQTYHVSSQVIL